MNPFRFESAGYGFEIEQVAAELVRDGIAAPWDAVVQAHRIVQERRRRRASERHHQDALERLAR